jgi:hypothetical protein
MVGQGGGSQSREALHELTQAVEDRPRRGQWSDCVLGTYVYANISHWIAGSATSQISQSQPVGWCGGLLCNRSGRCATVVDLSNRNSNWPLVDCVISDAQFFGDASRFSDTGRRSTCFVMGFWGSGNAVGPCAMDRSFCGTWRFLQTPSNTANPCALSSQ